MSFDFKNGILKLAAALIAFGISFGARASEPVCAKDNATLRKGPGTNHPVSWKVARYMPFLKTDRKGQWSKVEDLEDEEHWIKTSDLTNKFRCIVVKTNIATLRKEPSSTAQAVDLKSVDKYTPFKRLASDRDWVQIEDETGRQAWVHESQIWKPVTVQAITF